MWLLAVYVHSFPSCMYVANGGQWQRLCNQHTFTPQLDRCSWLQRVSGRGTSSACIQHLQPPQSRSAGTIYKAAPAWRKIMTRSDHAGVLTTTYPDSLACQQVLHPQVHEQRAVPQHCRHQIAHAALYGHAISRITLYRQPLQPRTQGGEHITNAAAEYK
jgi:hypothetical protein